LGIGLEVAFEDFQDFYEDLDWVVDFKGFEGNF
jgi:hypothetical protein